MIKTTPEQNKAVVLQAFDTLFNKRDYKAAERYWSSNYIQHSAHIAPGRDGLFNLVRSTPPPVVYDNPRCDPGSSRTNTGSGHPGHGSSTVQVEEPPST